MPGPQGPREARPEDKLHVPGIHAFLRSLTQERRAIARQILPAKRDTPPRARLGVLLLTIVSVAVFAAAAHADQNPVQVPTGSPLPGLTLVNDTNAAFKSLATVFSGASPPTTALCNQNTSCTTAGYLWHDTGTNTVKLRDQADSAWVTLFGIDETNKVGTAAAPVLSTGASQLVSGTNHYPNIVLTASAALSLSQASTLWNGFAFTLFAQGGNVTLVPNAADRFNGGTAGASLVVPEGYSARLVTDAASPGTWSVALERMTLGNCTVPAAATVDLGAQGCPSLTITGATGPITSFGATAQAGQVFFVTLASTPQLVYEATAMILNTGGANYVASAGDRLIAKALGAGDFEVTVLPASGQTPVSAGAPLPLYTSLRLSVTSSTGLSVSAGSLTLWNANNQPFSTGATILSVFTSNLSSCTVGTINCLDTGTLAASSWYYVWAIGNGVSVSGLLSASAASPALPSGYSYKLRLGAVRVNASNSLMATLQVGRIVQYVVGGVGITSTSILAMATGTASQWTAVPTGNFVPPTAGRICFWAGGEPGASQYTAVTPSASTAWSGIGGQYGVIYIQFFNGGGGTTAAPVWFTLESSNIYYASNATIIAPAIMAFGWEDNL